jgi:Tfp pilus assembly protein PilF
LKDEIEVRKNADTIFLLALTYKELNQWAQARDSVESLLRTGASQSRYYLLASTVFLNLGNISKAKLYNDLAIGLDPLAKERLIFL